VDHGQTAVTDAAGQLSPDTGSRTAPQVAASAARSGKADFGWLAEALWSRVEKMKRYPQLARINHWEGKVILRAVIREDGELLALNVAQSSGHPVLDEEALASVKQAFPLGLPRSLGQPQVALQIPISYRLDH
jgi:protein TonB